jgi:hypothetical protein
MQLQSAAVILTVTAFVAGGALEVSGPMTNFNHMDPPFRMAKTEPVESYTSIAKVRRAIKVRRDRTVQGFFDDDYANDADWEKFTEKGGALVCNFIHFEILYWTHTYD